MLNRLSGWIYSEFVEKHMNLDGTVQKLKKIYTCTDGAAREKCRDIYVVLIKRILAVLAGAVLLSLAVVIGSAASSTDVVLDRQGYGGEEQPHSLETEIDGEKMGFDVDVKPLVYTDDEISGVMDKGFNMIDNIYLGENQSADDVRTDLKLVERLDDLGLDVDWISGEPDIVASDGKLVTDVCDPPKIVQLTAVITYGEHSAERDYTVRVTGRKLTGQEKALNEIKESIDAIQNENKSAAHVRIPSEINGYKVNDMHSGSGWQWILLLGVVAAVCMYGSVKSKVRNMEKSRREQLIGDYPELVDKLTLYIGAGVTVRGAFTRIVNNSEDRALAGDSGDSALVREIRYTLNEINSGIPESDAYYNMGHRINVPVYIKLMSLLSQNIKKGTKDILIMMSGEEQAALQTRKEIAKRRGEEAGTKLLFPMITLLGVVMVIVILPAIMNF